MRILRRLVFAWTLAPRPCQADEPADHAAFAPNAAHAEIGGSAVFGSFNYERRLTDAASLRAGVGGYRTCGDRCELVTMFPVMACGLAGSGDHRMEVSAGVVVLTSDDFEAPVAGAAALGYRLHPLHGGLLLRVAFTPLIGFSSRFGFFPWAGASLGAAF